MNPPSAATHARGGWYRAASWLCRLAVLGHAAGMFAIVHGLLQTQFGNLLFMHFDYPHETAVAIEKVTVSIYLGLAVVALFYPCWPVLVVLAAYAFIEGWSRVFLGGERFSEYALFDQALRWTMPLVVLALEGCRRCGGFTTWRRPLANGLLRVGIATVFLMHGLLCWWQNPKFVDLILGSLRNTFGGNATESAALEWMSWIAIVDFGVAAIVLLYPLGPVLAWAAFWGLITALSRVTSLGLQEYHEVLVRTSHFLAPLALWCLLLDARRARQQADQGVEPRPSAGSTSEGS